MKAAVLEKIEQYLNEVLPREELINFETQLEINEELATEVRIYSSINTEMRNSERFSRDEMELRKTLNKLNATYFKIDKR